MITKNYANLDYGGRLQQTHFRTAGSGPPLILLHLFRKGFGNRAYWQRVGERFGFFPAPEAPEMVIKSP